MSFFKWFSRSADTTHPAAPGAPSGRSAGTRSRTKKALSADAQEPHGRKAERNERRESLYAVVRESMTGAGLLSGSYKFKVLSLDSRGRQYLIMVDLAEHNVRDAKLLLGIESHIGKIAKNRHDLLVTAMYWRINEQLGTGEQALPAHSNTSASPAERFEPLQPSEIEAFKRALSSVPAAPALSAPGEIIKSAKRNPAPVRFSDAELNERLFPLGTTQYGELN